MDFKILYSELKITFFSKYEALNLKTVPEFNFIVRIYFIYWLNFFTVRWLNTFSVVWTSLAGVSSESPFCNSSALLCKQSARCSIHIPDAWQLSRISADVHCEHLLQPVGQLYGAGHYYQQLDCCPHASGPLASYHWIQSDEWHFAFI